MIRQRTPRRPRSMARVRPTGPAPAMMTEQGVGAIEHLPYDGSILRGFSARCYIGGSTGTISPAKEAYQFQGVRSTRSGYPGDGSWLPKLAVGTTRARLDLAAGGVFAQDTQRSRIR